MKPKRKNRTYNPVLLLFYTIMRMIFFPIYLTGKIIEILSTLIVPASATLYLYFWSMMYILLSEMDLYFPLILYYLLV